MRVILSTQAKLGLREIALFIARDNPARARTFVRELRQKVHELGNLPRASPLVPTFERSGIRRRPYRDYLILYRIEDDRITVVHSLHGARDHEALLSLAPGR